MGFIDTVNKAKAFDANERDVTTQNAQVAEYAKNKYLADRAAQQEAQKTEALGLAKALGKQEMMDDLRASQLGTIPAQVREPRFAQPTMREAMQPYGLAEQHYANQYNGGVK
ncbi:MAG: hypothetical protein ACYDD5_00650 [Sulfuricurvum sp.]